MVALALAVALASCGEASDSESATTPPVTGAKQPTGEPITIGFLNPDQGPVASPMMGQGQRAALARINADGGIKGRPLKVSECHTDSTPEKVIACANEFVDERVVAVMDGLENSAGAALPILHAAKIPLIGPGAFNAADLDPKSYYFQAGQGSTGLGQFLAFKRENLEKITYYVTDNAGVHGYMDKVLIPLTESLGLTLKPVYYQPANVNFTTGAAAIVATDPDVAGALGFPDEGQCTAYAEALRATGFEKPIYVGYCSQFVQKMGAAAEGVYMQTLVWLPQMRDYAPPEVRKQLDEAEADMRAEVPPDQQGVFNYMIYSAFRTFADVAERIQGDKVDAATFTAAVKAVRDVPTFLGPRITCDERAWPGSSACADQVLIGKATAGGKIEPIGGGFITAKPPT